MTQKPFFHSGRRSKTAASLIRVLCVAGAAILCMMYIQEKNAGVAKDAAILMNESRELAFHGEVMLGKGRLTDAEKLALSILPEDLTDPDRPYSVDAERLLRNCHMYRNMSPFIIDVDEMAVSMDDEYVYGEYYRWGIMSGERQQICPSEAWHPYLSPDCSTIIYQLDSLVCVSDIGNGTARTLLELDGEQLLDCTYDHLGGRALICIAPEHYSTEFYRALYLYDIREGELVDLDTREYREDRDEHVDYAFSNDGRWMVEVYEERDEVWESYVSVEVWDLADYEWKSSSLLNGVNSSDYGSRTDTYIVNDSLLVCGVNVTYGQIPKIGGLGDVCSVDIEPVTGNVAIVHEPDSEGRMLHIYDQNGQFIASAPVVSADECFYVNENVLCAYDIRTVYLYDASTLQELMEFDTRCAIDEAMLSPDCTKLLVKPDDGEWMVFDLSSVVAAKAHLVVSSDEYAVLSNGEVRSTQDFGLIMNVPASEMMALGGNHLAVVDYGAEEDLKVYDLKTGQMTACRDVAFSSYDDKMVLSPSGRYLSYYKDGYDAEIMDLHTGEVLVSSDESSLFEFSEDGSYIYGAIWADAHSGTVMLASMEDLSEVTLQDFVSHRLPVSNKGRFWIDYEDGAIVNLNTGERAYVGIEVDEDYCYAIWEKFAFSESDEYFLLYDDDFVKVYETDTWKLVFERNDLNVDWVSIGKEGYMSLVSYADGPLADQGRVVVYDTGTWQVIREFTDFYSRNQFPCMPYMMDKDDFFAYRLSSFNDSVGIWCSEDSEELVNGQFCMWDKKAGGFVVSVELPELYDGCGAEGYMMTAEGDVILSVYEGIRMIDMPDLQTLIGQGRERYGI